MTQTHLVESCSLNDRSERIGTVKIKFQCKLPGVTGSDLLHATRRTAEREDLQQEINERYPTHPPADWSPYDCGESWDED